MNTVPAKPSSEPRQPATDVLIVLLVALLPALQPLILGCLPRFDGPFHLYRLAALERALRYGDLYPRWLADLGLGFGFPLFNYYAPLSYYLTLTLRLLGLSFESTLLGGFGIAQGLLALGTYLWARDLFDRRAGLVAAFAISYAPYPLLDVHYRGALAEIWGLAWLSLSLWLVQRLARRGGGRWFAATALAGAALMLSHNVVALVGIPLLFGYALFLTVLYRQPLRDRGGLPALAGPTAALLLSMALSAFFWVPALMEQDYVQISALRIYDYREHFLALRELFGGPQPTDPKLANRYVPHSIGWAMPVLALLAWAPRIKRGLRLRARPEGRGLAQLAALTAATLLLIGMTLSISAPLWAHLPMLDFLQFPWRFLGPASIGLALLAGAGAARLPGSDRFWVPLLLTVLIALSLTWLFPPCTPPQPPLTPPNLIRIEAETGGFGTTTGGDYLPRAVDERPTADMLLPVYEAAAPDYLIPRLDPTSLPEGARVLEAAYGLTDGRLVVESDEAFRARFRWYYFPGWRISIDGDRVSVGPDGPHGLLSAEVPAGRHTLEVTFGDTPLRRTATTVSAAALLILIGIGIYTLTHSNSVRMQASPPRRRLDGRLVAAVALVSTGIFGFKTLYLERYDNVLRPQDFDGTSLREVDVPLRLRFGDKLFLLGYDLGATHLASDDPLQLTLYWHTAPPLETDYSIAVHLVDPDGNIYGQSDKQHPGGHPTRSLLPGEYIRDPHHLSAFRGTPSGSYTVVLTAYEAQTGRSLEVRDADGTWHGVAYALAQVEVTRPEAFPSPESLPVQVKTQASLADGVQLVGSNAPPTTTHVGASFPLVLFWEARDRPTADYQVRIRLLDADGNPAAEHAGWPGRTSHPTSAWQAGEVIRDAQDVRVPPVRLDDRDRPLTAGRYTLDVALVDRQGRTQGPPVVVGALDVDVPTRSFQLPESARPLDVGLGDAATLAGYALGESEAAPGESVGLTLYWRAEAVAETAYTVFVHLINERGEIVTQRDRPPANGTRPTTGWLPGEIVEDAYTLTLPPGTPAGTYTLKVGLYEPRTYVRLPATGPDGAPAGDGAVLPVAVRVREE